MVKKPVLSPSTIKGYTTAQKVFKSEFKAFYGKKLYNIDDTAFQNVVNQMYTTRSAKTVINYCGFVNTVMKANRCQELKITLPPRTPRRTDIPDADKMREITRAAEGTRLDISVFPIFPRNGTASFSSAITPTVISSSTNTG